MAKWQEIENMVLNLINDNRLKEGDPIPPDKEIAKMARSSMQPVLRAMYELDQKGVIYRKAGRITTVRSCSPVFSNHQFSFSYSTKQAKLKLENRLLELGCRLPNKGEFFSLEERAQKSLNLKRGEPFYIISRLRLINGTPRAIHRAYLNPSLLPEDFIAFHDFERESLIDIYISYGIKIKTRNTKIRARFPLKKDTVLLKIEKQPILESEQILLGTLEGRDKLINIEFLLAWYVNWEYQILDRRAF